jgi:Flp pilus assembly protein TadG
VEFLVVVPILLLLFFGIAELGGAWRTYQVITNTAREGARAAVLPNATEAGVLAIVNNRLTTAGLDAGAATVQIICAAGPGACFGAGRSGGETEVRVSFSHTFILLGPVVEVATGGGGEDWGTITMQSGIVMRNE